jgi:RHS repeat-associated protein
VNGSVATETYPSVPGASDRRNVTYTLDSASRLSSLTSSATSYAPAASVSSIGYASHNGLKTETYSNSLIHAVSYNNRLQSTEIKLGTSGNPTSVLDLTDNYGTTNNNGNVQSIGYSGGGLSYTQGFGYDALNRLTTSSESGSSWSQTNAYDRYGNRWIDLGAGNQSLYFTTGNNRITSSGYGYDSAGNLTNDGVHAYTFDAENKISKVDTVSAYVYDGEGQRVRKLVGENTRFIYGIGGQLVAEYDGSSGNLKKEYVSSGLTIEPSAVNSNGTQYATADHLGSPRVITNSSASVVSRHDYMPFGEELGAGIGGRTTGMGFSNNGDDNRKKFTSKERDNETGLDYFLARYHSSTQGRFTSPDEFRGGPDELYILGSGDQEKQALPYADITNPQSLNKYTYCYNNPLCFTDPDGHLAWPWHFIITYVAGVRTHQGLFHSLSLAWKTAAVDLQKDSLKRDPANTNKHAMAGRDPAPGSKPQSAAEAQAATAQLVTNAMQKGDTAGAGHAVQDASVHEYKEWKGYHLDSTTFKHLLRDFFPSPGTVKQAYENEKAVLQGTNPLTPAPTVAPPTTAPPVTPPPKPPDQQEPSERD